MAKDICVGVDCKVQDKDLFDKDLKDLVIEQIKTTVEAQVNKNKSKGIYFKAQCPDGWQLTATVNSLTVDDPDDPTTMEVKIAIKGVPMHGTAEGFDANGKRKVSGISVKKAGKKDPKKVEKEVRSIVGGTFEELLQDKVIPHMTKP
jgi:hypothetical protein